eukprot:1086796-Prymnesium_polylepis.1
MNLSQLAARSEKSRSTRRSLTFLSSAINGGSSSGRMLSKTMLTHGCWSASRRQLKKPSLLVAEGCTRIRTSLA